MIFKKIINFLNSPKTALVLILLFFIGFFLAEGLTGGFDNNFVSFGPTKDETGNPAKFMGITLDTWNKVGIVYTIIFISAVLEKYYYNVMHHTIHTYVSNVSVTKVPYSQFWSYLILLIDPFIETLLYIVKFYAAATFQIQYILPQFIASYLTDLPFTISILASKQYIS